jgi:2-polyprenyl-3-methyl-5-hydroxy-6-metoxy-1,4-benzoquinol methylase
MNAQEHWETVYASKSDQDLSWTQPEPGTSLSLIADVCPAGRVIDVGGGSSFLAERLLDRGYSVTVLDISRRRWTRPVNSSFARAAPLDKYSTK